jgi:CRISPR-associated protein Cas5d
MLLFIIEAHFEMTAKAGESDNPEKHYNIFLRRARTGQCFHRPYLGCREFSASFELIEKDTKLPETAPELKGTKDLGWMLYDMEFKDERAVGIYGEIRPIFFRAEMNDGIINVAKQAKGEVKR